MRYVFVSLLSLLVGGAVYAVTLLTGREEQLAGLGFVPEERGGGGTRPGEIGAETSRPSTGDVAPAGPGYTYLRVATTSTSLRQRIQGFVGLVVLIAVSSAVLALAVYQVGHLINQTIERFVK